MAGFLSENNACGQNLLRLVSNGNSILSEIFRMKDNIPDIYRLEKFTNDQQNYKELIMDFSYLNSAESIEEKIEQNPELQELDNTIRNKYLELLTRFYSIFESTYHYAIDLRQFVEELNQGYFIQQSLENVLQDAEGKQLMCESLYIFGVILLVLDFYIPGTIRERLLISYYRYKGFNAHCDTNIDEVCLLLRSTGYIPSRSNNNFRNSSKKVVKCYPEAYFSRFKFNENLIDMIITRLRCDDIYNQLLIYPHQSHRSTALSNQAAMLLVCLYFAPKILHTQNTYMREIVDKFFTDNWVVSMYMGITVNLIDAWHDFKAAKNAISSITEIALVKEICLKQQDQMNKLLKETRNMLNDGILKEKFILENLSNIVVLIRNCNVTLRWYFIHATEPIYYINSSIADGGTHPINELQNIIQTELQYKESVLLNLLLHTAQLELIVRDNIRYLLQEKSNLLEKYRKQTISHINELILVFSGQRSVTMLETNLQLKSWFEDINQQIMNINIENIYENVSILIQIIQALEEVQLFHNMQSNVQAKQHIKDTQDFVTKMIQITNVRENILIDIQLISDFSYAVLLIDRDFTKIMQENIKLQPKSVIPLRAAFLKLASALENPLMRINQCKSGDLISVSSYYSSQLVNYIRSVLQIIPETMFQIMANIIDLQTNVIKELPTKVDKKKIKEYIQWKHRFTVAELTRSITVFTEGILMMKTTLVGVIELDPKQLLEDGIRKELVKNLSNTLHQLILTESAGKTKNSVSEIEIRLENLSKSINGYRRSFEYIQDYLNINGVNLFQEELIRIINYNVEKECNLYIKKKKLNWQSNFQSVTIPIPDYTITNRSQLTSYNFIGCLANEILQCTDPHNTIYIELKFSWYERRPPHKIVLDNRFFTKLLEAISPAGIVGLSRVYSYMLTNDLRENLEKLQNTIINDEIWSNTLQVLTNELESNPLPEEYYNNPLKFYATYHQRWTKVWPIFLDWILHLGQKQVLREQLTFKLNCSSKCEAKNLQSTLETFNKSILNELQNTLNYKNCRENSQLLLELNDYLLFTGSLEPLEQVHIVGQNSHNISLFFTLFTIAHIGRLDFSQQFQKYQTKSFKDQLNSSLFLYGLVIVFRQYHNNVRDLYLSYLSQFVTALIGANISEKNDLAVETVTTLQFMELFVQKSNLSRTVLTKCLPAIILNEYKYISTNN